MQCWTLIRTWITACNSILFATWINLMVWLCLHLSPPDSSKRSQSTVRGSVVLSGEHAKLDTHTLTSHTSHNTHTNHIFMRKMRWIWHESNYVVLVRLPTYLHRIRVLINKINSVAREMKKIKYEFPLNIDNEWHKSEHNEVRVYSSWAFSTFSHVDYYSSLLLNDCHWIGRTAYIITHTYI